MRIRTRYCFIAWRFLRDVLRRCRTGRSGTRYHADKTRRTRDIPMCGVPVQCRILSVPPYPKRIRVAVCEQTEDPAEAKSEVQSCGAAEVVRVVTPGTVTEDALLMRAGKLSGRYRRCRRRTGLAARRFDQCVFRPAGRRIRVGRNPGADRTRRTAGAGTPDRRPEFFDVFGDSLTPVRPADPA